MSQRINDARKLLLRHGREFLIANRDGHLGKLNIRDLTTDCGMAMGTFYHYFTCKDDLVIQIMDEDWQRIIEEVGPLALQDEPLYDKLKFIYERITRFASDYVESTMALLSPSTANTAHRVKQEHSMNDLIKLFLKMEVERGELILHADYDSAAYLLIKLFMAAGRNPAITFDTMWRCMNFRVVKASASDAR